MAGLRERVRRELTDEIVRLAREQVAQSGATALSLRAVARELGMASSAIYRYFPSRDELLTRLIIDSYDRLGEATEHAAAAWPADDLRGRWIAVARAIRTWAFEHPAEYGLLFGTPVPGYRAPDDTIGPASRYTAVLLTLLGDLEASGQTYDHPVAAALHADYAGLRQRAGVAVSDSLLMLGMAAWTNVLGTVTLELFGHLHNVVDTPGVLFDAVVALHADTLMPGTGSDRPTSNAT